MDLPSTETPVVALHRVGLVGGLCGAEIITEVAIGVKRMSVGGFEWIVHRRGCLRSHLRVLVALLIVMQGEAVQDQCGALGNEHAVIHEVFG